MKFKRLFSMLMAIAMILSLLPVFASAAETTTVYFKPGVWNVDGAWFDVWRWGGSTADSWVTFTDNDGDGVFEGQIPVGTTGMIFLRKDPSKKSHSWDCWNRIDFQTYNNSYNCLTITDWSKGSWSTYTPVVVPTWESPIVNGDSVTFNYWSSDDLSSVCVCDTINNWTVGATPMTKGEDGIWTVTVSGLYNGQYEYKFVTNGSKWINDPKNTGTKVGDNNTFQITDGLVDISEPEYTSPVVEGSNVTFNYWQAEEFTSATVFGDMSGDGWATAYPMVKNEETGVWSVTVENLYNGTYEYKIVVDEAWLADPKNTEHAASGNSVFTITEGEEKPVIKHNVNLHFQDKNNWSAVYAYVWTDGSDPLVAWPGAKMEVEAGYNGWYTLSVNEYTNPDMKVIFNDGVGGTDHQTADLSITALPEGDSSYWYIPGQEHWTTGTLATEAPESYVQPETATCNVTIHFQNTLGWENVNCYAWTNTWPASYPAEVWPGTALVEQNGWYTLSFAATYVAGDGAYVIFNTSNGTNEEGNATYAQTADLKIACDGLESVEKWIVPTGEKTDYLSEICQILDSQPAERIPVAEIYDVGTFYTLEEAYAAADPDNGDSISLLADISVNDLVIDKEMYLDLNGHNATINAASATAMILVQDSKTVDPEATEWGTLIVNGADCAALGGYLMIPEDQGHSFHSYELSITHISLNPAKDALGFKAQLVGDARVLAAVTEIGFAFSVNGGEAKEFKLTKTPEDGIFTARLNNILANNGGEMTIAAAPFVCFGEELVFGDDEETTMMATLQTVDANWSTYTEAQQTAVKTLCDQYKDVTDAWNLENIFSIINIPIN